MLQRLLLKSAEAAGDLIGNKIADKNTSVGKTKSKEKEDETKIYIPLEKTNKLLMTLDCFKYNIEMEHQKIINLLDTTSDNREHFGEHYQLTVK